MTMTEQQKQDHYDKLRMRKMLRLGIGCTVALFVFALILFAYFFAK